MYCSLIAGSFAPRAKSSRSPRSKFNFATSSPVLPAKPRSRHVPAAVRREIWQRDEGRCTYTDEQGNRCEERCFLEIEHLQPFALNGATSVSNCTLRCRYHNTLAAELTLGVDRSPPELHMRASAGVRPSPLHASRDPARISSVEHERATPPRALVIDTETGTTLESKRSAGGPDLLRAGQDEGCEPPSSRACTLGRPRFRLRRSSSFRTYLVDTPSSPP